jgi:hypothetical protein
MAIPGFTAEAAFYPTPNLYRTLAPGGPQPTKGVTAQQYDDDWDPPANPWWCQYSCDYDADLCRQACSNMADWAAYCFCVCSNQYIICLNSCGITGGEIEWCMSP